MTIGHGVIVGVNAGVCELVGVQVTPVVGDVVGVILVGCIVGEAVKVEVIWLVGNNVDVEVGVRVFQYVDVGVFVSQRVGVRVSVGVFVR